MENEIDFTRTVADDEPPKEVNTSAKRCRLVRQVVQPKKLCAKEERNASIKKVSQILQKSETDRTCDEIQMLKEYPDAVEEVQERWRKRDEAKRRLEEFEDPLEKLDEKCQILAQAIAQSQHLVVYTGAGISTAAQIPDYRGPNGIWTRLQQGKDIGNHDLSLAQPTYTHMALSELYRRNILKYVVSQNCDGLHLRSGLPRTALSELHGNMYIEVCKNCKPHKEYWRLFDVTENTARYSHKTSRRCYACNEPLFDTIVHFGERGSLQWPLNWQSACKHARKATTILCLGSSLKVLKKYPWLWQMDKPVKKRPNLYIVNLQWTPKDEFANVKIHGKCDKVMEMVMDKLGLQVPPYDRLNDPIYVHATELHEMEMHTTTQPLLKMNENSEINEENVHHMETKNHLVQSNVNKDDSFEDCIKNSKYVDLSTKSSSIGCDKTSNSNLTTTTTTTTTSTSTHQCLPSLKTEQTYNTNNVFSINGILRGNSDNQLQNTLGLLPNNGNNSSIFFNSPVLSPSLSLLGYNLLSNALFGQYSDFLLYPYQTSFLYPGLHSIINSNFNITQPSIKIETDETLNHVTTNQQPACDHCDKMFNSISCLFYAKQEPVFTNQKFRFSKIEQKNKPNICLCCDYSTDEDDLDDSSSNNTSNVDDKEQIKNSKTQAGWFGKGYKKGRRPKRKSM